MSDDLLPQILSELKEMRELQQEMKTSQEEMRESQQEMRASQQEMKESQQEMQSSLDVQKKTLISINNRLTSVEESQTRMEKKLDLVYDQTANLTEFNTSVGQRLDTLSDEVFFISHKESQNEKEVSTIKRHLQIIK